MGQIDIFNMFLPIVSPCTKLQWIKFMKVPQPVDMSTKPLPPTGWDVNKKKLKISASKADMSNLVNTAPIKFNDKYISPSNYNH